MRSLARDFSSSRRAPPNAASKPPSGSASSSDLGLQQAAAFLRAQCERICARVQRFAVLCGRSAPRRFPACSGRETRSSPEICSWCRCAAGERESCRGKKPSAPAAASRRSLCRWSTASPAGKFRGRLAQDVDTLGFQRAQMIQSGALQRRGFRPRGWRFLLFQFYCYVCHLGSFSGSAQIKSGPKTKKTHQLGDSGGGVDFLQLEFRKILNTSLPAPEDSMRQHRQHACCAQLWLRIRDMGMTIAGERAEGNHPVESFF